MLASKLQVPFFLIFFASCGAAASSHANRSFLKNRLRSHVTVAQSEFRCTPNMHETVAKRLRQEELSRDFPFDDEWRAATPIVFCRNWRGQSSNPPRETEAQFLWSMHYFYMRVRAHYQDLFIYPETETRRENLWQRDVAEIFLQPDTTKPKQYKEFEISPNGNWLDLAIAPEGASNLLCPVKTNAIIDEKRHVWTAQLSIPMRCLTNQFDPSATWRLNIFRIEGHTPNRFYSAWQPTNTVEPNFHVPDAFGILQFSPDSVF